MITLAMFKKNWKRWAWSSAISFVTGFVLVITPSISQITLESLNNGAVGGVLFLAFRAGVKALFEYLTFLITSTKQKKK